MCGRVSLKRGGTRMKELYCILLDPIFESDFTYQPVMLRIDLFKHYVAQ